ncbi:hypothetical protein SESBI_21332 [Sesbania bispinosa]|nr:hypothetical protein SESBI_21332 [Sesbania bispinosa]
MGGADPKCHLCGAHDETELHLFRDCAVVKHVWDGLAQVTKDVPRRAWNDTFEAWMRGNITPGRAGKHSTYFGVVLWSIWEARNSSWASNIPCSPEGIVRRSVEKVKEIDMLEED